MFEGHIGLHFYGPLVKGHSEYLKGSMSNSILYKATFLHEGGPTKSGYISYFQVLESVNT